MDMGGKNETGVVYLDLAEALDRAMGDAPFLQMLLNEYFQNLPKIIDSLRAAVTTQDTARIQNIAHTLKGMSANLGCSAISRIAARLEKAGEKTESATSREILAELEQAIQQTKNHVVQIDWAAFA